MLNMVDRACTVLMAVVAHFLAIGGMLATALPWALAFVTRRSGSGRSNPAHGLPLVWQQLLDPAVQLRGQPDQHKFKIGPGLVPVELGRLQQAHHHRSPLARQLAADEQPVPPPPGPRAEFGSRHGCCRSAHHRPAGIFRVQPSASSCSRWPWQWRCRRARGCVRVAATHAARPTATGCARDASAAAGRIPAVWRQPRSCTAGRFA